MLSVKEVREVLESKHNAGDNPIVLQWEDREAVKEFLQGSLMMSSDDTNRLRQEGCTMSEAIKKLQDIDMRYVLFCGVPIIFVKGENHGSDASSGSRG